VARAPHQSFGQFGGFFRKFFKRRVAQRFVSEKMRGFLAVGAAAVVFAVRQLVFRFCVADDEFSARPDAST